MEKILVSACLLGHKTKYNGRDNYLPELSKLHEHYEFIPICPEVDGLLPIPRPAAEFRQGKIINRDLQDVSENFACGAQIALDLARKFNIRYAILKDLSPSCGSEQIYDGSFQGILVQGQGMTAKLLMANGIKVFNENNFQHLLGDHDE